MDEHEALTAHLKARNKKGTSPGALYKRAKKQVKKLGKSENGESKKSGVEKVRRPSANPIAIAASEARNATRKITNLKVHNLHYKSLPWKMYGAL